MHFHQKSCYNKTPKIKKIWVIFLMRIHMFLSKYELEHALNLSLKYIRRIFFFNKMETRGYNKFKTKTKTL